MMKIHFYLKMDKIKSNGQCPIYAKIVLHNKSITLSTGKSILRDRWEKTDHLRSVYKNSKEKVIKEMIVLNDNQLKEFLNIEGI